MIVCQPRILSSEWMLIGRQEVTAHGGRIDLLAIAPGGTLVLMGLKHDRTSSEVVAQALDYASRVAELTAERIVGYDHSLDELTTSDLLLEHIHELDNTDHRRNQEHPR